MKLPPQGKPNWERKLEKAMRALLRMPGVKHTRPPAPSKEDLARKFVMRIDRKGNPTIKEV